MVRQRALEEAPACPAPRPSALLPVSAAWARHSGDRRRPHHSAAGRLERLSAWSATEPLHRMPQWKQGARVRAGRRGQRLATGSAAPCEPRTAMEGRVSGCVLGTCAARECGPRGYYLKLTFAAADSSRGFAAALVPASYPKFSGNCWRWLLCPWATKFVPQRLTVAPALSLIPPNSARRRSGLLE